MLVIVLHFEQYGIAALCLQGLKTPQASPGPSTAQAQAATWKCSEVSSAFRPALGTD